MDYGWDLFEQSKELIAASLPLIVMFCGLSFLAGVGSIFLFIKICDKVEPDNISGDDLFATAAMLVMFVFLWAVTLWDPRNDAGDTVFFAVMTSFFGVMSALVSISIFLRLMRGKEVAVDG